MRLRWGWLAASPLRARGSLAAAGGQDEARASERASEGGRARGRRRGRGEDGSALSKYKSGREASKPGAEPKSRQAVTRPHGRRRRLLRGARLRELPSRELARRGESDARSAEDAGGGRASRAQRGPRERPKAAPGPCGTARRDTARRRPRAPLAGRPPLPRSLPGATWLRPLPPPPRTS